MYRNTKYIYAATVFLTKKERRKPMRWPKQGWTKSHCYHHTLWIKTF